MRTNVSQAGSVRHVRIDKHIGDLLFFALLGKRSCFINEGWCQYHAVKATLDHRRGLLGKRGFIIQIKEEYFLLNSVLLNFLISSFYSSSRSIPIVGFIR